MATVYCFVRTRHIPTWCMDSARVQLLCCLVLLQQLLEGDHMTRQLLWHPVKYYLLIRATFPEGRRRGGRVIFAIVAVCATQTVKNSGYILDNLGFVNIKVTSVSYRSIGWPASHVFIHFVNCSHSDCSVFVAGKSCGQGTIMAKPHPEKAASKEVFRPPSFLLSLGNILT